MTTLGLSRESAVGVRLAANPDQYKICGITHAIISSGFSANLQCHHATNIFNLKKSISQELRFFFLNNLKNKTRTPEPCFIWETSCSESQVCKHITWIALIMEDC